jgi:hypothetical protein
MSGQAVAHGFLDRKIPLQLLDPGSSGWKMEAQRLADGFMKWKMRVKLPRWGFSD